MMTTPPKDRGVGGLLKKKVEGSPSQKATDGEDDPIATRRELHRRQDQKGQQRFRRGGDRQPVKTFSSGAFTARVCRVLWQ